MTDTNNKRLPRLWRHHLSGVLIGYILGPSDELPGHILFEGRRIWSWSGGRLECSQLAKHGARQGDRLGEWTVMHIAVDGSIDLYPCTEEVVEASRALPADGEGR